MPNPPMKRKITSAGQFQAKAQPREETMYNTAIRRSALRPPKRWPSMPALSAPTTVPHSAIETVIPFDHSERLKINCSW